MVSIDEILININSIKDNDTAAFDESMDDFIRMDEAPLAYPRLLDELLINMETTPLHIRNPEVR